MAIKSAPAVYPNVDGANLPTPFLLLLFVDVLQMEGKGEKRERTFLMRMFRVGLVLTEVVIVSSSSSSPSVLVTYTANEQVQIPSLWRR